MTKAPMLETYPLHLGLGATAIPQPQFTGEMAWYMDYSARCENDGVEGRLVSMHSFTENWAGWEMHPAGAEVVVVTAGEMTLIQQSPDGGETRLKLKSGEYAINPPGVWHTAEVATSATALFITAGYGTETRPR